jgi:hypothetical protein
MKLIDLHLRETPPQKRNYSADEPMHPLQIKKYREMTPAEKLDALAELYASACAIYAAGVRKRHPEYTEEEVQREVRATILYGVS